MAQGRGGGGDPDATPARTWRPPAGRSSASIRVARGDGEYTIPLDNPFYDQPPKQGRSGGTASATRGVSPSIVRQVIFRSVTWARRLGGDRLRPARLGLWTRHELRLELPRGPARLAPTRPLCLGPPPPVSPSRSRVPARRERLLITRRLRSSRSRLPRWSAATCTATLRVLRSGTSSSGARRAGRRRIRRGRASLYTSGEDACARVYAGSGNGAVYRLIRPFPPPPSARLPCREAER